MVFAGGELMLVSSDISYGYNFVVDHDGNLLSPRATPLEGGEQLVLTDEYQEDLNTREYARVMSIMAPIRDAILYHFGEMSRPEWLAITEVLAINGIKLEDADVVDGRAVLSTVQVYDYIATGEAEVSPVARYLEEAGLELKCLAFENFDFTNPEGANPCVDHGLDQGSGIITP